MLLSSLRSVDTIDKEVDTQNENIDKLELLLICPDQHTATLPTTPPRQGARAPTSPLYLAKTSPLSSGHYSATPSPGSELLVRLRLEVDQLREERHQAALQWSREREQLLRQLAEARSLEPGGKERLGEVEAKLRDILSVIRSLNTMKISEEVLGRLVLEAVEEAYDPVAREVAVFRFLALLYQSTRDYERQVADHMLTWALEAVGEDVMDASDSSSLGLSVPEGMSTLQPRKIQDTKDQEDMYQIHV